MDRSWICTSSILFLAYCWFYKHSHLGVEPLSAAVDCWTAPLDHVSANSLSHSFFQSTVSMRWPMKQNHNFYHLTYRSEWIYIIPYLWNYWHSQITSDHNVISKGYRDDIKILIQFPSMQFFNAVTCEVQQQSGRPLSQRRRQANWQIWV